VDGRGIGERSDAVLRTAMPGHDVFCHDVFCDDVFYDDVLRVS
jgi:hypothetical protein